MSGKPNNTLFERFLHSQTSGSIVLILATVSAVIWANSPWTAQYNALSHLDIGTWFAGKQYHLSVDHWVKDGLMAVFFFVVGLEIKREILIGELSSVRKAILPVMAAFGGAVVPALIYFSCNPEGIAAKGWGVPMATDIAFALGVLALFGSRVPLGLKVFLTALAIVDDLMAVIIIALFYTSKISLPALFAAFILLAVLAWCMRVFRRMIILHLLLASAIWLCVFLSGIHATIAGVLIALTVPLRSHLEPQQFFAEITEHGKRLHQANLTRDSLITERWQRKTLEKIYFAAQDMMPAGVFLEDQLHTIQAFFILPLFALFSAGVTIDAPTLAAFPSMVSFGIILGLVVGKQIGVFCFSLLIIKARLADMPTGVSWSQLWGASALAGIGFTMSIFISELAFTDSAMIADAKISIFIASILAAVTGFFILHRVLPKASKPDNTGATAATTFSDNLI